MESNQADWYNNVKFSWFDYSLFSSMLVLSALIGIYFGCFGNKQSSANEYLMGGRAMKVFPIAMSLVASHTSGVTLLAAPADVYKYGIGYCVSFISIITTCIVTSYMFLPIFYKLQLTSTYEYLKLRFDTRIRVLASSLYGISVLLQMPIVIYIPALAFSQATGINVYFITPLVCGVCIFYTTIGGLKAVVWTDTIQFTITVGSVVTIFVMAIVSTGIKPIYLKALQGERLEIDFDMDPTKRETFLGLLVGWTLHWIAHVAVNQGCIQKFLSLPTLKDAKKSLVLFGAGILIIKSLCVSMGVIIYSRYYNCDPLTAGIIKQADQLFPYYVMDVAGQMPGLPGLFIAGVFCTALSTLSANLNCLAGTIYEDFIARFMPKSTTQQSISNILKLTVLLIGVLCTLLVFVVEQLGGLLPLSISFWSVTSGALLGMFLLGVIFPKANSTGTFYGALASLIFMTWWVSQVQWYKSRGLLKYPTKPLTTDGCNFQTTTNQTNFRQEDEPQEIFYLFRITYYYYAIIGALICILVALPISYFTKSKEGPPRKDLLIPLVRRFAENYKEDCVYYSVSKAAKIVNSNT